MWKVVGGIFFGWGLGANDSANIFGPSVVAEMVRYRTAIILTSFFVIIGALIEGPKCMDTVGKLSGLTPMAAFTCAFAAAVTMLIMTYLKLPASASQAIVGAVLGAGIFTHTADFSKLYKIVICWVMTPIGAILFSMILYRFFAYVLNLFFKDMYRRGIFLTIGVLVAGCYGAYSLGSNNVANVTGVYVGAGMLNPFTASLVGGLSIVTGVLTYSRGVMMTVGKRIVPLDAFSAFVATLSNGLTIHVFTQLGVPVSSSQAIVGAIVGVGLVKGLRTVSGRMIATIGVGWVTTPLSAGILSYMIIRFL
ncbi:MAG: inorganic phosphate transporter [Pseudomonadota bacterium]